MWFDPEEIANEVYAVAGADVVRPPGVYALCRDLNIRIQVPVFGMHTRARLSADEHGFVIHLAPRTSPERRVFLVAHELAEWWVANSRWRAEAVENVANGGGAAIIAPAPAFKRAVAKFGHDPVALARAFGCTPTWAALRLAEVWGVSAALVTPDRVHRRGQASEWGTDEEIRTMARGNDPWVKVHRLGTGKYFVIADTPNFPMVLENSPLASTLPIDTALPTGIIGS